MGNPNRMTRTFLRWTHLLTGWPIGVFAYTPARESETFVLLMQAAVILTGLWTWQQARILCIYKRWHQRPRRDETNGPEPTVEASRNTQAL